MTILDYLKDWILLFVFLKNLIKVFKSMEILILLIGKFLKVNKFIKENHSPIDQLFETLSYYTNNARAIVKILTLSAKI